MAMLCTCAVCGHNIWRRGTDWECDGACRCLMSGCVLNRQYPPLCIKAETSMAVIIRRIVTIVLTDTMDNPAESYEGATEPEAIAERERAYISEGPAYVLERLTFGYDEMSVIVQVEAT